MTAEQLEALKAYTSALIDERIENAFGRDSGHAYLKCSAAEEALDESVSSSAGDGQ